MKDPIAMRFLQRTRQKTADKQRVRRRGLRFEGLESRKLLAAEGAAFELSETFDSTAIIGSVAAEIRWGDGRQTPASSVERNAAASNLKVQFDYSLDSRGFFSGANVGRRQVLQAAANAIVQRFGDDLAAIEPNSLKVWQPSVFHPSSGPANQTAGTLTPLQRNLPVPKNTIIIYAGARDLPGNRRGVGGNASYAFPAVNFTCRTQSECDRKVAEINAFRDTVRGRGEPGAVRSPNTDVAPSVGSISFDTETDWYFGFSTDQLQPGQVDFMTVATHEIAHVLGFGLTRSDVMTSWANLTSGGSFRGSAARAIHGGNVPIDHTHWADSVSVPTAMSHSIATGSRQLLSPLDYAAMDDLGWELLDNTVDVAAEHHYADNGRFPVDVLLSGSLGGSTVVPVRSINVSNVVPTLTVPASETALVGLEVEIADIALISDPGFANPLASPATEETFSYTINWGDGSPVDTGLATIDRGGSAGKATLASVDGRHVYQSPGPRIVRVQIRDDDGGTTEKSFPINVSEPTEQPLQLTLNASTVVEGSGQLVRLTVSRGEARIDQAVAVSFDGGDATQIVMPNGVTIPAGQPSATIEMTTIDNLVAERPERLQLTASAANFMSAQATLRIVDDEPALFQNASDPLDVNNSGKVTAKDALLIINQLGRSFGTIQLDPAQQQPDGIFLDTNGDYSVTAIDALLVINRLISRPTEAEAESLGEQASISTGIKLSDEAYDWTLHDQALRGTIG